jgi:polysaccharide biosynthesis/export protein
MKETHPPAMFPSFPVIQWSLAKAGIVSVVGDGHQPSGFVMDHGNISVLQAVAMAQGANPTAGLNDAKIIRRLPNGPQEIPILFKKMLEAKAQNMLLQPDVVFVSNSTSKSAMRRGLEAIVQTATGVTIYGRRRY